MGHRIGGEARRRIGVTIAALNAGDRDMRRRGVAGRGCSVMAIGTVRVARRMDIGRARPGCVTIGCFRVASDAVLAIRRQMARVRRSALRTFRAFGGVGPAVTGIAARSAYRGVVHCVGYEAHCRIVVAVAALNRRRRDMRRRRHAGRRRSIVTAKAVCIARLMDVDAARPAQEAGARVTGDAVAAGSCDVVRERGGAERAFGALARVRTVVTGVAAGRAHRRMVHRVGDETRRRIGVAVAALDAGDRNMRWRRQAGRGRPVVTARAIGVGRLVNECATGPACVGRGCAGVAVTQSRPLVATWPG